jgi:hypothetical protein
MTEEEEQLLVALARMCDQYLKDGSSLDHMSMSAGERAVALLVDYGLLEPVPRGGVWTEAGEALLLSK